MGKQLPFFLVVLVLVMASLPTLEGSRRILQVVPPAPGPSPPSSSPSLSPGPSVPSLSPSPAPGPSAPSSSPSQAPGSGPSPSPKLPPPESDVDNSSTIYQGRPGGGANPILAQDKVASAERSFSKLKLLKSYLRSTMSQERLSGLAMIAIENGILVDINCEELINQFAMKNAMRASRIIIG
ncbi:zinc finger MYM-type protein 1 [Artemisia annua]|uniref:Zinc finger MYM-type protein 1 n=1 Tax=Artemisia annua TaxID=35608 RepID=A0A2U1MJV4_ARTAN|nr:zinc finger MYM-type protein 1 [Artemisia annua]